MKKILIMGSVVCALLTAVPAPSPAAVDLPWPMPQQNQNPKNALTYGQLRNLLMDFADQYMQMIAQAADTLVVQATNPETRIAAHAIKLYPCSAAFSIAADQNPQIALLDMIVLVHLQGTVWKNSPMEQKFGEDADLLLEAQTFLESEIDGIALKALTIKQLEHLKKLVREWHERHPRQRYVSYIRFTDFAELRRDRQKEPGANILSIGGLLSAFNLINMDEASRSVDQARMVAERALYLAEKMPMLIRWQTKMLFYELAVTPEIKNVLLTSQTIQGSTERLVTAWEGLPAVLAAERKAAIQQLAEETDNRSRTIIREATKSCLLVIFAIFVCAIVYKFLTLKLK
jgi:hypothetical protein